MEGYAPLPELQLPQNNPKYYTVFMLGSAKYMTAKNQ